LTVENQDYRSRIFCATIVTAQTPQHKHRGKENPVNTLVPADAHRKTTRALALLRELFLDLGDRRIADAIRGLLSVQSELAADEAAEIVAALRP
jgi:hypothetical protein